MPQEINEAVVKLTEGMQFIGQSGSGHAFVMDGAKGFGDDTGPRPMEVLLIGLAGCTGMDVAYILRKQRVQIEGFKVKVTGKRAEDHPKIYTDIEIEYIVQGRDIQEKQLLKAIELSATRFCSASVMLGKSSRIVHKYTLKNDSGEARGTFEKQA